MSTDQYLHNILFREAVDTSTSSPVRKVQAILQPIIAGWAGDKLRLVHPTGSFVKGTAIRSGTDIDLFISLSSQTTETLKEIYTKLFDAMEAKGCRPRKQNVSINVSIGGYSVDLVPAKHQGGNGQDHSLYRRRADTWTKTNVMTHIAVVRRGGRIAETRILKLWRNQWGLDFPSFYLELATIQGLSGRRRNLSHNVLHMFEYLRDTFPTARFVDRANTNNIISDDLTPADRAKIKAAAAAAMLAMNWNQIVT